jgi:sedoheptulokinase
MSIVISLDIGTSKICALGYCVDQQVLLDSETISNNCSIEGLPYGYHEQAPKHIINCSFSAIKALLDSDKIDVKKVTGIAVTGQMHGVLLIDGKCHPATNLITWRDQRAANLTASVGCKYAKSNGCGLRAGYGGATLSFLAKNMDLGYDITALSISDYACMCLSGICSSEPTHAASWGIYDVTTGQWNWNMVRELSIPETVLPKLKPASCILGSILPEIAETFGLNKDVIIYSPLGDNQAAVVGAGGDISDVAILNLGTGGQISIYQNDWQYLDGFETRPMPGNTFVLVGASICGGWTYAYLKDFYKEVIKTMVGVTVSDQDIYAKMNSFLESDAGKPRLFLKPWFCGTRTDPTARGEITFIGAENFTPKQVTIAFAKSMVEELLEMIPASRSEKLTKIIACGNAVRKNPVVLKIAEKCFKKPVFLAPLQEEAAAGAALSAINVSCGFKS